MEKMVLINKVGRIDWWHIAVITAVSRLKLADQEFKTSPGS